MPVLPQVVTLEDGGAVKEIDQGGEAPLATATAATLPLRFRFIAGAVAFIPLLLSTIYIARYTYEPERFVPPTELGLTQFILGGALVLFLVITP
jgi:hypothetical protein